MFNKKVFSFQEILAFLAGAVNAPEGVQVKWTSEGPGWHGGPWLSGLLSRSDGSPVGLLQLIYEGNDPRVIAKVRTPNGVKVIELAYQGAYLWPREVAAELRRPLEQRGRKVPQLRQQSRPYRRHRRRAVRRKVARE